MFIKNSRCRAATVSQQAPERGSLPADPHPVRVILARGGGMGPVPEGGIQQLGRAPTPLALLACYPAPQEVRMEKKKGIDQHAH